MVAAKGICTECNPSSNYLIGTSKQYRKHPISRFYSKELTIDKKESSSCPQLSVSINTDDQSVFYTSLENEYALMRFSIGKAQRQQWESGVRPDADIRSDRHRPRNGADTEF